MELLPENSSFSSFILEIRKTEPKCVQPTNLGDACVLRPSYWWPCWMQLTPFVVSWQIKLLLHVLGSCVLLFFEWNESSFSDSCFHNALGTVRLYVLLLLLTCQSESQWKWSEKAVEIWKENTEDMNGYYGRYLVAVKYQKQTVGGARWVTWEGRWQVRGTGLLLADHLLAH